MNIDYSKLSRSVEYYSKFGFVAIDAPWWVNDNISNITKPSNVENFHVDINNQCLVASGEQSFLSLISQGLLPIGTYQTITPCFRDDSTDWLHRQYFMKNELIDIKDVTYDRLINIIDIAELFFKEYVGNDIKRVSTSDFEHSYDLMSNDIEIGSYGIRTYMNFSWIYATGCAEPRLSIAEFNRIK